MTFRLVDTQRLMNNARISLPGALDGAIWEEIFNVLTEFCDHSNTWYEDIEFAVPVGARMGDLIEIEPSTGGRPNRLIFVAFKDTSGTWIPRNMSMPQPGVLQFGSTPDTNSSPWTARVALCPNTPVPKTGALEGIPQGPDWLLQQYHNGLLAGVMYRMCMQPAKPYSNAKIALVHFGKFRNAISQAKTEFRKQNLFNGQTWVFPQASTMGSKARSMGSR